MCPAPPRPAWVAASCARRTLPRRSTKAQRSLRLQMIPPHHDNYGATHCRTASTSSVAALVRGVHWRLALAPSGGGGCPWWPCSDVSRTRLAALSLASCHRSDVMLLWSSDDAAWRGGRWPVLVLIPWWTPGVALLTSISACCVPTSELLE